MIKSDTYIQIVIFFSIFIVLGSLCYLYYSWRGLKQALHIQQSIIRQQTSAAKGIIEAEENDRMRIAGDLHDGVGQLLSATRMNLDTLLGEGSNNSKAWHELATKTLGMVDDGCREVRSIAHQMMPNVLLKRGLMAALRDMADQLDSPALKVSLETAGIDRRLDSNIELVLYRVIEESVTNVLKHAGANQLYIQLVKDDNEISVTIEDNGAGFNSLRGEKIVNKGLKNINNRVEYLKGTVEISSAPGKGTLIAIIIPLTES